MRDVIGRIVIRPDAVFRWKPVGEAEGTSSAIEERESLAARKVVSHFECFMNIFAAAGGASGKGYCGHVGALRIQKYDYSREGQNFPVTHFHIFLTLSRRGRLALGHLFQSGSHGTGSPTRSL